MAGNISNVQVSLSLNQSSVSKVESQVAAAISKIERLSSGGGILLKSYSTPLGRISGHVDEFTKSLEASNARVIAFGASAGAIFLVQQALRETVLAAAEVEKKLQDISVILGVSGSKLSAFGDSLFEIAKKTGQSFDTVSISALELSRQGLSVEQTLLRTRDALILSRLSGLDVVSSTEAITAALNTFNKTGLDSTILINKLANVDASFAVSSADLAEAIKRVGSSAGDAGVGLDELIAIVTSAQQTTARGGSVIGNSLKTIFTRIQRPEVLNDLGAFGVAVKDASGQSLSAIQILKNFADVYDSLSPAQKSLTSELLGGVYQINILKAAVGDLGKEYSIYDKALGVSVGSTDQAIQRNNDLNVTLSALFNETANNAKKFAGSFGKSAFDPAIRSVLAFSNDVFSAFAEKNPDDIGSKVGKGIVNGIGKFLSTSGIALIGFVGAKLFANFGKFAINAVSSFTGMNSETKKQQELQQMIQNILIKNPEIIDAAKSSSSGLLDIEKEILRVVEQRNMVLQESERMSKSLAMSISPSLTARSNKGGFASGFIPNFNLRDQEVSGALQGGYKPGRVVPSPVGGVMNTAEQVKYVPGFEQPFINPPKDSEAGREHKKNAIRQTGINPYARGFVPKVESINIAEKPFHVKDGDTVTADATIKAVRDFRLSGIDAAEGNQYLGPEATNYAQEKVGDYKQFSETVNKNGRAAYDRLEFINGKLARGLIQTGLGVPDLRYTESYKGDVERAKAQEKGIWSKEHMTKEGEYTHPKAIQYIEQLGIQGEIDKELENQSLNKGEKEEIQKKGRRRQGGRVTNEKGGRKAQLTEGQYSSGFIPNFERAFTRKGEAITPGRAIDDKNRLSPVFKKIYKDQSANRITFLDFDGTLVHTRGDAEYAKASTPEAKSKVLQDLFSNPGRINDIKSSRLTPFGSDLKARIDANQIRPDLLGIMTASEKTAGMPEYINQTWKIPIDEAHQRYGDKTGTKAAKMAELRAASKLGKGPAVGRLVDDLAVARGFVPNFGKKRLINQEGGASDSLREKLTEMFASVTRKEPIGHSAFAFEILEGNRGTPWVYQALADFEKFKNHRQSNAFSEPLDLNDPENLAFLRGQWGSRYFKKKIGKKGIFDRRLTPGARPTAASGFVPNFESSKDFSEGFVPNFAQSHFPLFQATTPEIAKKGVQVIRGSGRTAFANSIYDYLEFLNEGKANNRKESGSVASADGARFLTLLSAQATEKQKNESMSFTRGGAPVGHPHTVDEKYEKKNDKGFLMSGTYGGDTWDMTPELYENLTGYPVDPHDFNSNDTVTGNSRTKEGNPIGFNQFKEDSKIKSARTRKEYDLRAFVKKYAAKVVAARNAAKKPGEKDWITGFSGGFVPNFAPALSGTFYDFDETLTKYPLNMDKGELFFPESIKKASLSPRGEGLVGTKDPINVLTAREINARAPIEEFLTTRDIPVNKVLTSGSMFKGVKVQGARGPRKLNSAEKKAELIKRLIKKYQLPIHLVDDSEKNVDAIRKLNNPLATAELYEFEEQSGFGQEMPTTKAASSGLVPNFNFEPSIHSPELFSRRSGPRGATHKLPYLGKSFGRLMGLVNRFNENSLFTGTVQYQKGVGLVGPLNHFKDFLEREDPGLRRTIGLAEGFIPNFKIPSIISHEKSNKNDPRFKREEYNNALKASDVFLNNLTTRRIKEGPGDASLRNTFKGFVPNFKETDPSKLTRWSKIKHFNPTLAVFRKPYLKPDGTGVGSIEIGKDPMTWGNAYETFLKNGGLESIGFSNIKHVLGGAPIDFLAKYKTGDPYALDAKIGHGDADSAAVLGKLSTMIPFVNGKPFQGRFFKDEYLKGGFKEEEFHRLKTGIVFGNASDSETGHKQIARAARAGVDVGGDSIHATISEGFIPNFTSERLFGKTRRPKDAPKSKSKSSKDFSGGFIPNFNREALLEAIDRENEAGIPFKNIKVETDKSLSGPQNPLGLGVYNNLQERNLKEGIKFSRQAGINPKTKGSSEGFVPNFVDSIDALVLVGSMAALTMAFKDLRESSLYLSDEQKKEAKDKIKAINDKPEEEKKKAEGKYKKAEQQLESEKKASQDAESNKTNKLSAAKWNNDTTESDRKDAVQASKVTQGQRNTVLEKATQNWAEALLSDSTRVASAQSDMDNAQLKKKEADDLVASQEAANLAIEKAAESLDNLAKAEASRNEAEKEVTRVTEESNNGQAARNAEISNIESSQRLRSRVFKNLGKIGSVASVAAPIASSVASQFMGEAQTEGEAKNKAMVEGAGTAIGLAGTGMQMGSAFGPWGAIAGGIIGGGLGIVKAISGVNEAAAKFKVDQVSTQLEAVNEKTQKVTQGFQSFMDASERLKVAFESTEIQDPKNIVRIQDQLAKSMQGIPDEFRDKFLSSLHNVEKMKEIFSDITENLNSEKQDLESSKAMYELQVKEATGVSDRTIFDKANSKRLTPGAKSMIGSAVNKVELNKRVKDQNFNLDNLTQGNIQEKAGGILGEGVTGFLAQLKSFEDFTVYANILKEFFEQAKIGSEKVEAASKLAQITAGVNKERQKKIDISKEKISLLTNSLNSVMESGSKRIQGNQKLSRQADSFILERKSTETKGSLDLSKAFFSDQRAAEESSKIKIQEINIKALEDLKDAGDEFKRAGFEKLLEPMKMAIEKSDVSRESILKNEGNGESERVNSANLLKFTQEFNEKALLAQATGENPDAFIQRSRGDLLRNFQEAKVNNPEIRAQAIVDAINNSKIDFIQKQNEIIQKQIQQIEIEKIQTANQKLLLDQQRKIQAFGGTSDFLGKTGDRGFSSSFDKLADIATLRYTSRFEDSPRRELDFAKANTQLLDVIVKDLGTNLSDEENIKNFQPLIQGAFEQRSLDIKASIKAINNQLVTLGRSPIVDEDKVQGTADDIAEKQISAQLKLENMPNDVAELRKNSTELNVLTRLQSLSLGDENRKAFEEALKSVGFATFSSDQTRAIGSASLREMTLSAEIGGTIADILERREAEDKIIKLSQEGKELEARMPGGSLKAANQGRADELRRIGERNAARENLFTREGLPKSLESDLEKLKKGKAIIERNVKESKGKPVPDWQRKSLLWNITRIESEIEKIEKLKRMSNLTPEKRGREIEPKQKELRLLHFLSKDDDSAAGRQARFIRDNLHNQEALDRAMNDENLMGGIKEPGEYKESNKYKESDKYKESANRFKEAISLAKSLDKLNPYGSILKSINDRYVEAAKWLTTAKNIDNSQATETQGPESSEIADIREKIAENQEKQNEIKSNLILKEDFKQRFNLPNVTSDPQTKMNDLKDRLKSATHDYISQLRVDSQETFSMQSDILENIKKLDKESISKLINKTAKEVGELLGASIDSAELFGEKMKEILNKSAGIDPVKTEKRNRQATVYNGLTKRAATSGLSIDPLQGIIKEIDNEIESTEAGSDMQKNFEELKKVVLYALNAAKGLPPAIQLVGANFRNGGAALRATVGEAEALASAIKDSLDMSFSRIAGVFKDLQAQAPLSNKTPAEMLKTFKDSADQLDVFSDPDTKKRIGEQSKKIKDAINEARIENPNFKIEDFRTDLMKKAESSEVGEGDDETEQVYQYTVRSKIEGLDKKNISKMMDMEAEELGRYLGAGYASAKAFGESVQELLGKYASDLSPQDTLRIKGDILLSSHKMALDVSKKVLEGDLELFKRGAIDSDALRAKIRSANEDAMKEGVDEKDRYGAENLKNTIKGEFTYTQENRFKDLDKLGQQFSQNLSSGISGAMSEAIMGTKSLKAAFADMFGSIAEMISRQILEMGVKSAMSAAFGFNRGGLVKGYSTGGEVFGGSGTKDDVPAYLSRGEYVIKKESVNKYGVDYLSALNRMEVNERASGGSSSRSRDPDSDKRSRINIGENFADINLKNSYVYDDMKRPTRGEHQVDEMLSAYALTSDSNPQNALKFEKANKLDQYLLEKKDYEESKEKALKDWEKQKKARLYGNMAQTAIGLGSIAATGGFSKRASGGPIYKDNIPTMLTGGEFVIKKDAVDKYGSKFFDRLNEGSIQGFSEGGLVGAAASAKETNGRGEPSSTQSNNVSIVINIDSSGGVQSSNKEGVSREDGRLFAEEIKASVLSTIIQQKRVGGLLYKSNQ